VNKLKRISCEAQACVVTQELIKHYKYSYYYMSDI